MILHLVLEILEILEIQYLALDDVDDSLFQVNFGRLYNVITHFNERIDSLLSKKITHITFFYYLFFLNRFHNIEKVLRGPSDDKARIPLQNIYYLRHTIYCVLMR